MPLTDDRPAAGGPLSTSRLVRMLGLLALGPATCLPAAAQTVDVNRAVPGNAPVYMRWTYLSAMGAPRPLPLTVNTPVILGPSQLYLNAKGLVGVHQTGGTVFPASNAFFQPLGTNGRSCFTCHQPADGLSITPATARTLYNLTAGRDPLFAPVDGANCPNKVPKHLTLPSLIGGLFGAGSGSAQAAYSLLLNKGLIRIFLPVPQQTPDYTAVGGPPSHPVEFKIEVLKDPYGCNTDPTYAQQLDPVTGEVRQIVSVYRRPRISANLPFVTTPAASLGPTAVLPHLDPVTLVPVVDPATGLPVSGNIMWDGREPTLESQAINATLGHAQALRAPTAAQVKQIVDYEKAVFVAQSHDNLAGQLTPGWLSAGAQGGPEVLSQQLPSVTPFATYQSWPTTTGFLASPSAKARASIARGQAVFNNKVINVDHVAGANDITLVPLPRNPDGSVPLTCGACHGNIPGGTDPLPTGQRDIGVGGHAEAFGGPAPQADLPLFKLTCHAPYQTVAYGNVVITNDPGKALITGRCADIGRTTPSPLRGLASRAPYFSNGSAQNLRQVVDFYNRRFKIGFTEQESVDLTRFLEAL